MSEKEVVPCSGDFSPLFLSPNANKTKKVMGRLKVHPTGQTAPLFEAAGCSEPSMKFHFQDYFQHQGESKGPEGQISYLKMMVIIRLCLLRLMFFIPEKARCGHV